MITHLPSLPCIAMKHEYSEPLSGPGQARRVRARGLQQPDANPRSVGRLPSAGGSLERAPSIRRLLFVLLACAPLAVAAQVQVTNFFRGSNAVTFTSRGGYGPYLVRTSTNLFHWSDQGDLEARTNWTLSAFGSRSFYRVADVNASNHYGGLFGLIQSEQGEFGDLMARHRLKTRLWLYKTKGAPHTDATSKTTNYWGKLQANFQTHSNGQVQTWSGALETLGRMTTTNANNMTLTWTNGTGAARRVFTLAFDFPYSVSANRNNSGITAPKASDPYMTLRCTYATPQPELDWWSETLAFTNVTVDTTGLVQMNPGNPTNTYPTPQNYRVSANGVQVNLHFLEGYPLHQGEPPWILKTFLLDRWLSPTTAGGGSLPAFSTDSYFSRTLKPGHHNFFEVVLIEPALDPALSEATRAALAAANIRYIYTLKDVIGGLNPDDIRYFGFDNKIWNP
jgi:hypothetical protein